MLREQQSDQLEKKGTQRGVAGDRTRNGQGDTDQVTQGLVCILYCLGCILDCRLAQKRQRFYTKE